MRRFTSLDETYYKDNEQCEYEKYIHNTGHKICRKRKLRTPRRAWEDNITKNV
jgi:hypothetical protein